MSKTIRQITRTKATPGATDSFEGQDGTGSFQTTLAGMALTGATGPTGPTGPTGGTGPTGPTGATGGGNTYQTSAVSLDGSTYLTNPAITTSDSHYLSASIWFFIAAGRTEALDFLDFDPANTECPEIGIQGGATAPIINFEASNADSVAFGWSLKPAQLFGGWHNILIAVDTSRTGTGGSLKQALLYLDDQFVPLQSQADSAGGPLTMLMSGLAVGVPDTPDDDTPLTGYMSDYWVAPGQYVDFSVVATRRLFIDANGRPVNLGDDGSTPTGTAPAIFFALASDDSTATDWGINLGTGGDFTWTGTPTIAPSSPSG